MSKGRLRIERDGVASGPSLRSMLRVDARSYSSTGRFLPMTFQHTLIAAAVSGILAGAGVVGCGGAAKPAAEGTSSSTSAMAKHDCAGKNDCKGQGGCKGDGSKHDCKGKNDCKGQGGCKTT